MTASDARRVAGPPSRPRQRPADASSLIGGRPLAPSVEESATWHDPVAAGGGEVAAVPDAVRERQSAAEAGIPGVARPVVVSELPAPAAEGASSEKQAKVKLTTLVTPELRRRLRAALTATQSIERDHSLNDFVVKLIEREVVRREALYNDGEPFEGGNWAMIRGRKPSI